MRRAGPRAACRACRACWACRGGLRRPLWRRAGRSTGIVAGRGGAMERTAEWRFARCGRSPMTRVALREPAMGGCHPGPAFAALLRRSARARAAALREPWQRRRHRARAVVGVGFPRGRVELVPSGRPAMHLRHLRAALRAPRHPREHTLSGLRARAPQPIRYGHRGIVYRFFRSVRRTTPSAYAGEWTIAYNVAGSLYRNDEAILATLAHEIFHLNDEEERFSSRALRAIHRAIVRRCGMSRRCLAPYSPTATTVRGGTYYAFQPNNGERCSNMAPNWPPAICSSTARCSSTAAGSPRGQCAAAENARACIARWPMPLRRRGDQPGC